MKNPWQVLLGRERLWVVFWLYCVLGLAVFLLFLFTSDNTQRRAWGYAARIYACVILAGVSLSTLVNIESGSVDVLSVQ